MPLTETLLVGLEILGIGAVECAEVDPWEQAVDAAEEAPVDTSGHTWRVACADCVAEVRIDPVTLFGPDEASVSTVLVHVDPDNQLSLVMDQSGRAQLMGWTEGVPTQHWSAQLDISAFQDRTGEGEAKAAELHQAVEMARDALRLKRSWTLEADRRQDTVIVRVRQGKEVLAEGEVALDLDALWTPVPQTKMHRVGLSVSGEGASSVLTAALTGPAVPTPRVAMEVAPLDLKGALAGALKGQGLSLPTVTTAWKGAGCALPELPELPDELKPDPDAPDADTPSPDSEDPDTPALAAAPSLGGPPTLPDRPSRDGSDSDAESRDSQDDSDKDSEDPENSRKDDDSDKDSDDDNDKDERDDSANEDAPDGDSDSSEEDGQDASEPEPEADSKDSGDSHISRILLTAGASALAGSATSLALSANARSQHNNLDTPYADLDGLRSQTNTTFLVGASLGTAGAGLTAGAIIAGRW